MKVLAEVPIFDYIKYITISGGKDKYYKKEDKLPKKYSTDEYVFDKSNTLINANTGEKVIKSKKKPKILKIHGQTIWSGISHFTRSKLAKEMKTYFYQQFRNTVPQLLDESLYPIGIRIDVYDNVNEGEDLDNMMLIYRKSIQDALCGNVVFKKQVVGKYKNGKDKFSFIPDRENYPPKIIDDNKNYIQEINTRFYPIENGEIPALFIQIYSL